MEQTRYTLDELRQELLRFEAQLRSAGLRENSVQTYEGRSSTFLAWRAGDCVPRGPVQR